MASRPQEHPTPQQRPSATASSGGEEEPSSPSAARASTISFDSEDSQSVLVQVPSSSSHSQPIPDQTHAPPSPKRKLKRVQSSNEPKKCWICFSDETEDTPTSSRWRSPCPCALRAHEACLLDWIADLESPGSQPKPIECPQCKSQIQVKRPKSFITPLVGDAQAFAVKLTLPFVVASVAGTVVTGLWLHGFCTVFITFGSRDANRLLGLDVPMTKLDSTWSLGMPLIPLSLIAMRINSRNVDHTLAILPAAYFYASRDAVLTWPPSPATALAAFGWAQLAYRHLYRRYLSPLEQKWMKELRPRAFETQEAGENGEAEHEHRAVGPGMEVGFEVHFEVEEEVLPEDAVAEDLQPQEQPQAPPANDTQQAEPVAENGAEDQRPPPAAAPPAPAQERWEHMLDINVFAVVQRAMGALLFPTIAAAVGQGLKTILPRTWTTPPIRGLDKYPPGFLQSRFGRTIVGGCLFVVLKDTLQFYSTYQLATSQKHRSVLNYDEIPKRQRRKAKD